jgi:Zn finger protein HypA/HybF involved in hydrogenase expression
MTPALWSQMTKAMRDANRGECVSYRNIDAVVEMEESDYQGRCERCGTAIDTRKAYHQQERMAWGGNTIKVAAYYCDHCRQLLTMIGKGERTPMQERATERPDNTPTYKED